jgi:hypothetical protein
MEQLGHGAASGCAAAAQQLAAQGNCTVPCWLVVQCGRRCMCSDACNIMEQCNAALGSMHSATCVVTICLLYLCCGSVHMSCSGGLSCGAVRHVHGATLCLDVSSSRVFLFRHLI